MLVFPVPEHETNGGTLRVSCFAEPGAGGSGRHCQLAEAWLSVEQ